MSRGAARAAPLVLALALAAVPAPVAAQDPAAQDVAAFDAAFAAIPAETDPAHRALAARALDEFLKLPDSPQKRERLDRAAAAALFAGEAERALGFAADARESDLATPLLWTSEIRALARLSRPAAVAELARDAAANGRWDAAAQALRAEEMLLLPQADRLLRAGGTAEALSLFTLLARAFPGDGVRLANLALAQRHAGLLPAALETYRRAVAAAPDDPQVWNDFGLFQRATGMPAQAAETFRKSMSLEVRPGEGPAVTNLVHMEVLAPGSAGSDPLPLAAAGLALRPDAAMLRRVTLELILDRAAPQRATDKGALRR